MRGSRSIISGVLTRLRVPCAPTDPGVTSQDERHRVIIKEGKELLGTVLASVFVVMGGLRLLTPLRDEVSRRGFPMWLLGLVLVICGLFLWGGVVQNLLRRRR